MTVVIGFNVLFVNLYDSTTGAFAIGLPVAFTRAAAMVVDPPMGTEHGKQSSPR